MEILRSVEHPNVTSVFGTSTPPAGLSGKIRRFAFKYSELSYRRWLPLVLADRVGMLEGIIDDVKRGIIPNIYKERGWSAEWKYNRTNVIRNVASGVFLAEATFTILTALNHKSSKR